MPDLVEVGATQTGEFVRPRFGVEIEFTNNSDVGYLNESELSQKLTDVGLRCQTEEYNHRVRNCWKMTTDSSVGGDRGQGLELVSPPMRFEDRHSIRLAMQVIKDAGGVVNSRCGFHVHHEWPWAVVLGSTQEFGRNRPDGSPSRSMEAQGRLSQLLWMYDKFLPLIGVLIPRNRLTTDAQYTHSNKRVQFTSQWEGRDRYVALNFAPLVDGRNTVEFRQHQGTLNGAKALAWVEFTRQLLAAATNEYHARVEGRYEQWTRLIEPHMQDVLGKLTVGSDKYLRSRCEAKGTTLESVMRLVEGRVPDDPFLYGSLEITSKHALDLDGTLGARQFEPSDV